jgi:hypothetical protein
MDAFACRGLLHRLTYALFGAGLAEATGSIVVVPEVCLLMCISTWSANQLGLLPLQVRLYPWGNGDEQAADAIAALAWAHRNLALADDRLAELSQEQQQQAGEWVDIVDEHESGAAAVASPSRPRIIVVGHSSGTLT